MGKLLTMPPITELALRTPPTGRVMPTRCPDRRIVRSTFRGSIGSPSTEPLAIQQAHWAATWSRRPGTATSPRAAPARVNCRNSDEVRQPRAAALDAALQSNPERIVSNPPTPTKWLD